MWKNKNVNFTTERIYICPLNHFAKVCICDSKDCDGNRNQVI